MNEPFKLITCENGIFHLKDFFNPSGLIRN